MPTSIEAQGHTVDEAIQIALNQLGVSRDKVEIEILHHPRRGVLGIGARRAKVRATIRESVMLDGEEFDMSGGESLDDKPRRRRRRGGRSRGGARGEEGAEATEGAPRGPAPRPEGGREGARPDGGRGRDEGGRQREGRREDRRDDRRGGRGRGGERSAEAQQRGGQQQRGQGGRQDRSQDRSQDRPQDRGERTERQGQDRQPQDQRQDRQDRQGRQRGGDQRRDREYRGPRGDRSPQPAAPAAPEGVAFDAGPARLAEPAREVALSAPPVTEAIAAPELLSALPPTRRPPSVEEAPLDAETLEAIRARAEELVRDLLAKMGFAAEISSSIDEVAGEAVVSVRSDSEGLLIGRRGQTLDSLEHIINRMVLRGEAYVEGRVQLDIGDYRKRRRESLEELAGRLRARAVTEQRSVQVSPMSPRDRRYFAQAFAGDEAVEVRALGAGFYRRVIVAPAGMGAAGPVDPGRDVEDVEDAPIDVGTAAGLEAEH